MTENKEQASNRLTAGLWGAIVIVVILLVVMGYQWREGERHLAVATAELATAMFTRSELERQGTFIAQEATTSAAQIATATYIRGELEQ